MADEYRYNCEQCNYKCDAKSKWEIHINTDKHITGKKKKRSHHTSRHHSTTSFFFYIA